MDELFDNKFQSFVDTLSSPRNVLRGKVAKLLAFVGATGFERDIAIGRFERWIRSADDDEINAILRILRE